MTTPMLSTEKCPNDPTHKFRIEVSGRGRTLVCYTCKERHLIKMKSTPPPPKP